MNNVALDDKLHPPTLTETWLRSGTEVVREISHFA